MKNCLSALVFYLKIIIIFTALTLGNHHEKVTISPSSMEVAYFVNNSHIVTCSGHKGTKIQWLNPKGKPVIETKGRVHVEDRGSLSTGWLIILLPILPQINPIIIKKIYSIFNVYFVIKCNKGSLALVFEQISLADKGNWTCAAIDSDFRRNFRMIVNGK